MSLISVQNFVAPFKNPTHAITLILVAGLFGAYRYSGGSISSTPRVVKGAHTATPAAAVEETDEELITADEIAEENARALPPVKKATTKRGVLDQLIGRERVEKEARPAEGSGLDDIEKKLGLR